MVKVERTKRTSFFNVIVSERIEEYAQNYSLLKLKRKYFTNIYDPCRWVVKPSFQKRRISYVKNY